MIRRVIVKDFSAQAAKGEGQRMKVPKGRYSIKGHDGCSSKQPKQWLVVPVIYILVLVSVVFLDVVVVFPISPKKLLGSRPLGQAAFTALRPIHLIIYGLC